MSFNQVALLEVASQSGYAFNLYTYNPDNGDAIADVTGADYFSQSQFIGQQGWINGYIFCNVSDGAYIVQIDTTGTNAVQVGSGGGAVIPTILADIAALQADQAILDLNVRNGAVVDMGGGNYTLTDAQAQSGFISIINEGVGSTLTFPTSSDGLTPCSTVLVTVFATNSVIVAKQSGGPTVSVAGGTVVTLTTVSSGVANLSNYSNINARGKSNGVRNETTIAGNIDDADKGTLIKSTNAAATTLTVLSTMATNDFVCRVVSRGAGGVTIASDGTSVLVGKTALATDENVTIYREGSSNTFQCV